MGSRATLSFSQPTQGQEQVRVWCSLPLLGLCAQRQRHATACSAYAPTFFRCLSHSFVALSIKTPPPPRSALALGVLLVHCPHLPPSPPPPPPRTHSCKYWQHAPVGPARLVSCVLCLMLFLPLFLHTHMHTHIHTHRHPYKADTYIHTWMHTYKADTLTNA